MFPRKEDPEMFLFESLIAGNTSRTIENQEKRGQTSFIRSEVLPRKHNSGYRQQLEKMGVVFGEYADDLFIYVTLPDGWKKIATDHSMWSDLVDEKGRKRASIFYKAAFYDRDAFINLCNRLTYSVEPVTGWCDKNYRLSQWHGVVKDGDKILWETDKLEAQPDVSGDRDTLLKWYDKKEQLGVLCKAWLNNNYPKWTDPLAYWDLE